MRTVLIFGLGGLLALNGLVMLAAPDAWYALCPGVRMTGPFNGHFVRDIGAAYVAAGVGVAWFAARPAARAAALIAVLFLAAHALIHFTDLLFGREAWSEVLIDLPAIYLPPALAAWLVWSHPKQGVTT